MCLGTIVCRCRLSFARLESKDNCESCWENLKFTDRRIYFERIFVRNEQNWSPQILFTLHNTIYLLFKFSLNPYLKEAIFSWFKWNAIYRNRGVKRKNNMHIWIYFSPLNGISRKASWNRKVRKSILIFTSQCEIKRLYESTFVNGKHGDVKNHHVFARFHSC